MRLGINPKLFFLLLALNIFSIFAIFPYILTIQAEAFKALPIPLPLLIVLQLIQSVILFAVVILVGLILSRKVGFGTPLLDALLLRKKRKQILFSILPISIVLGIVSGLLIVVLDGAFSIQKLSIMTQPETIELWKRFLASFYGGISEETLTRLFLMSLVVWGVSKILPGNNKPSSLVVWIGIVTAALIFGTAHLPITSQIIELTGLVVLRGILLNGVGGVIFGYLFWKKGLESAMIAHFTTDIMIQIVIPFFT